MSVICLKAYREDRIIRTAVLTVVHPHLPLELTEGETGWSYSEIQNRLCARFGENLPAHFARCMRKPQRQPYMHGDVHNVSYRKTKSRHFNRPYPVPCEVTAESCVKRGDTHVLGSRCIDGVDEPFPWMDMKYRVSLAFLRSLPDGAEVHITTRSDLIAHDEYVTELKRLNVCVRILFRSGANDSWTRLNEPGAPSLTRRQIAVDKLRSLGIDAKSEFHEIPGGAK